MNINKFTQNSMLAVQGCEKIADDYGNQEIEQEHLLYSLLTQDGSLILKLMEKLGIAGGECTPDGKFSLDACRCVGACGLAPVMMINDEVYGRLTVDDLDGILAKDE